MEPLNVARYIYLGMAVLNQGKRDVLFMTPAEFSAIWSEHLSYHGINVQPKLADIDSLP